MTDVDDATGVVDRDLLTPDERDAVERPGARKRALAAAVFAKAADGFGLPDVASRVTIDRIRRMTKPEAKRFCKGLEMALQALETVGGMPVDGSDAVIIRTTAPGAGALDARNPVSIAGGTEADDADSNDEPEVMLTDTEPSAGGTDAAPVRAAENEEEEPIIASPAMRVFLREVTGKDHESYREADVLAATRIIVEGGFLPVTRTQPNGSKIDPVLRLQRFFEKNGDMLAIADQEGSNPGAVSQWFRKIRQKAIESRVEKTPVKVSKEDEGKEQGRSVQVPVRPSATPTNKSQAERPIEEEPRFKQIAHRIDNLLVTVEGRQSRLAALEGLLSNAVSGDITPAKKAAMEDLCGLMRRKIGDELTWTEKDVPALLQHEKVYVKRLTGFGMREDDTDAEPRSVRELVGQYSMETSRFSVESMIFPGLEKICRILELRA